MKRELTEACINILKSTLGDMSSANADKVVSSVIAVMENELEKPLFGVDIDIDKPGADCSKVWRV